MRFRPTFLALLAFVSFGCAGDVPDPESSGGLPAVAAPGSADGTVPGSPSDEAGSDDASSPDGPPPAVDPVIEQAPAPPVGEGVREASSGGAAAGGARPAAGTSRGPTPVRIPDDPPRFEKPDQVKGIYLTAWTAGSSRRIEQLIDLARRTEINSFVIDIKDATGYVSHASGVPLAREIGATSEIRIPDLPGLLRRLEAEGIYPIARIVVIKDPLLIASRPDMAVQDTAGGVWVDSKDIRWLNFYDQRVWDYHIELAREAAQLGFPEIQWDYVRFADAPLRDLERATYPGRDERTKSRVVRDFLAHSRDELGPLGVEVTADVFGITTSAHDVGIGQVWKDFIDAVDVALPMVYPSHYYKGSFGIAKPNAHPYEIIVEAMGRGVRRSEGIENAGRIRPWLQDFSMGEPAYGAPEVRAQIQATYDVGIDEWILWNAGSRYTEEALEPVGGWPSEPLIRVAGRVVPVSERHDAIRLAAAAKRDSIARAKQDSIAGARRGETRPVVRPDTAGTGGGAGGR